MEITSAVKSWYGMISTICMLSCWSRMPGTIGSIVACAVWLVFKGIPMWVIVLTAVVGCIASDKYEKACGREDPGECVIDEVVGYWLSAYGLDMNFAVVALFAFRIIDIIKPFPVSRADRIHGGLGIMLDDIAGGVIVNLLLRAVYWLFYGGGMQIVAEVLK